MLEEGIINNKMKLTVKTLKGSKFDVECEPSQTLSAVKAIIVSSLKDGLFMKTNEPFSITRFNEVLVHNSPLTEIISQLSCCISYLGTVRNRLMPNFQQPT